MPGSKHACPNSAACWSPATPAIGTSAPHTFGSVVATTALDEALTLAAPTDRLDWVAPVRAARAEAAWLADDPFRALTEARAAFDLAARHRHPWLVGELAYWRWKCGDLDTAPPDAAAPFALEIAGDWRAAAAAWDERNAPYEAARARAEADDVVAASPIDTPDVSAYVPASAIAPEKQRFAIYDETDEESDSEIEFLSALAAQVERAQRTSKPQRLAPAHVERVRVEDDADKLNVFRELKDIVEHTSVADTLPLQHVELSDLLDDLQTTAAALRLRRAA